MIHTDRDRDLYEKRHAEPKIGGRRPPLQKTTDVR
jgi:hypothetical protein